MVWSALPTAAALVNSQRSFDEERFDSFHQPPRAESNGPVNDEPAPARKAMVHLSARQKVNLVFDVIRKSSTVEEVAARLGLPASEVEKWLFDFLNQSANVLRVSPAPAIRSQGRRPPPPA